MTKDLHENLRKLRVHANYSQEYVAEKMGISLTTYSRIERGVSAIDFEYIVKAAQLYKMTLDELANYGDPQFQKSKNVKAEYLKKFPVYECAIYDSR
jgi:transcriptional regulator with XRE-family HTH domain